MDDNKDGDIRDKIIPVDIEDEMRDCYIDYAMSVIVSRALPDVRDGLKPVHRRILHAMNDLNLDPSKPYRKSARIVGDTMGKYHPHGDTSIYDAMVRMAQDFSMRYMLVDGQGNFGSVDGDSAAAQRYTEARFSRIAKEMLADIDKDTVDFIPNFEETEKEPVVLPSRFPNLLANGSSGIAVGMATNIPPHNLKEIIDATVKIIDDKIGDRETYPEDIMRVVKGPDFPTGGLILGTSGIKDAYLTGRGKIKVRGKVDIEHMQGDRERIVIKELPYQVNKSRLTEKIGELVNDKKIEGISYLADESDQKGMRLTIELKKGVNSAVVLNQLYKHTQLQDTFGVISIALVDNEPRTLTLLEMLNYYLLHQKDVITRRTQFELNKAQKRAHILEGLLIALDNLDEVINIMRSSKTIPESKGRLTDRFGLTDEQTHAVVMMTLGRLTGLEREKIQDEYNALMVLIKELISILEDEKKLYTVIKDEIVLIKDKYGDERRTAIVPDVDDIELEDLIEEQQDVITMTHLGYIKRILLSTYRSQNRGGRGIMGMQTRDGDFIKRLFISSSHNFVMFFTNQGRVYRTKAYEIPEAARTAKGMAIVNLLKLEDSEKVTAVIPIGKEDEGFLLMATRKGIIKKTPLSEFRNVRKGGLIAISLKDDDKLISVSLTDGKQNVFIATQKGLSIMFSESDVRSTGRSAAGVRAIRLNDGDRVVSAEVITDPDAKVLAVTKNGFGKCTEISAFKLQNRGGKGVKLYKITQKSGMIVGVDLVKNEDELMLITSEGVIIRLRVAEISTIGRITQGVKLMNLADGISVVGMAKIVEKEESEGSDI